MSNVVFIPGSPALVDELSPADHASHNLRAAARGVIAEEIQDNPRPIHIVSSRDRRWYTAHSGSFAAWGAPEVTVGDGHYVGELVARYVIGELAEVTDAREHIAPLNKDVLTVVVLDGSAGLTARAPLALIDSAATAHRWCEQALAGKMDDMPLLADAGVVEPELWHELAQLRPRSANLVASDSSLGVGRYVARWEV